MKNKILNSKAFEELNPITQIVYSKPKYIVEVIDGYEVAKSMGIDKYNEIFSPGPYKLNVITELLNNENNNNN